MSKSNKKTNVILYIVLGAVILGGLVMVAIGGSHIIKQLTSFLGGMMGAISGTGDSVSTIDFGALIKDFVLLIVGLLLAVVGWMILRSVLRKNRKDKKDKAALESQMGDLMQTDPLAMAGRAPQRVEQRMPVVIPMRQADGWHCSGCGERVEKHYHVCPVCVSRLNWMAAEGEDKPAVNSTTQTNADAVQITEAPVQTAAVGVERKCMYCGATLTPEQDTCPVCNHKYVAKQ